MAGALREVLARFGFDVDNKKLEAANKNVDLVKDSMGTLAKVFAGGVIYAGLKSFVDGMRETGHELHATSAKLGLSTQEWQKWEFAADLAGVSGEELATGIKFLQKNLAEAAEKGGDSAKIFKSLGIDIKDASGHARSGTDVLKETGLAIAEMKNPTERTAATLNTFGRSGLALIPFFDKGKEGVEELLGELDKLGGGLSDEAIEKLEKSAQASKKLDKATLSLKSKISEKLIPALTWLVEKGTGLVVAFGKISDSSSVLEAGLAILGVAGAAAVAPLVLAWGPFVLGLAAAVLFVDDLITAFRGGDSVIGALIEKLGFHKEWLKVPSADDWDYFFTSIGNGLSKLVGANPFNAQAWKDTLNNFLAWFHDTDFAGMAAGAGKALIEGLVNAIKAGLGAVGDAIGSIGNTVEGALHKALQWNSPSKLAENAGDSVPEGMILAFKNGIPAIAAQADKAGEAAIPKMSDRYAPTLAPSGDTRSASYSASHKSNVTVNNYGVRGEDAPRVTRGNVLGILGDDRRGMIADLEALGDEDGA